MGWLLFQQNLQAQQDATAHPVARLTQALSFGAYSMRRYGSFAGRGPSSSGTAPAIESPTAFILTNRGITEAALTNPGLTRARLRGQS